MNDEGPGLELIDRDAKRFAARMTRGGRLGVLRLPFLEDAWGGLEAGQPELVVEAVLSMLDNAIAVYLAYQDVEVPPGFLSVEALRLTEPELASEAWKLMTSPARGPDEAESYFRRAAAFVEHRLGVAGPVPSSAGRVTEPEYLRYRYASVYPAILLAEALGALELFPVPQTYLDASHEAAASGLVGVQRLRKEKL